LTRIGIFLTVFITCFAIAATASADIVSGGKYRLVNRCSGKVADVASGSTADGAKIQQWTWNGGANQQWILLSASGGYYQVKAVHSGKVADVPAYSTADGARVQQWPSTGGTNQQWSIQDQGNGYYKLSARHSGKAFEVAGGSTVNGAEIQQRTSNTSCAQQWKIERLDSATPPSSDGGTTPPSGPSQPVGGPGGTWRLMFQDEMNGTSVDSTRWVVQSGCCISGVSRSPANVSAGGGVYTLRLSDANTGASICTAPSTSGECFGPGPLPNGYALNVGGYAEARILFPGNGTNLYNWSGWWSSGPSWPNSGEHDIAEILGGRLTVNYHSPSGGHNQGAVPGYWGDAFHTYAIHRLADRSDVYWDGKLVKSYPTDDNGREENLLLSVGNGSYDAFGAAGAMKVDYVRVWDK
jgi:hypothetical protein